MPAEPFPVESTAEFPADFPADLLFPTAEFLARAQAQYAPDVRWTAPRRGLAIRGREALVAHLAIEAAAMGSPELQPLRRSTGGARAVEESVIRFVYAGRGIAGLGVPAGTRVELGRVRVLELDGGRIVAETCIETWSPLASADGSSAPASMAPRGRFAGEG
jgi:hypothetical protein